MWLQLVNCVKQKLHNRKRCNKLPDISPEQVVFIFEMSTEVSILKNKYEVATFVTSTKLSIICHHYKKLSDWQFCNVALCYALMSPSKFDANSTLCLWVICTYLFNIPLVLLVLEQLLSCIIMAIDFFTNRSFSSIQSSIVGKFTNNKKISSISNSDVSLCLVICSCFDARMEHVKQHPLNFCRYSFTMQVSGRLGKRT